MHMLNMRIIGIIMQLAEYEVFMPMDPFLRVFHTGWVPFQCAYRSTDDSACQHQMRTFV